MLNANADTNAIANAIASAKSHPDIIDGNDECFSTARARTLVSPRGSRGSQSICPVLHGGLAVTEAGELGRL